MFKKPLSNLKTSAPLRSSDRRKLKQRVVAAYELTSEQGDILLPEGVLSVKFSTYGGEPGIVYLDKEGNPLWFTTGKGSENLIPTVYTLWKKSNLLPFLSTPAEVIPILIGGADLMIPGVIHCPPSLVQHKLVAICQCTKKDDKTTVSSPLAVGRMALPSDQLRNAGMKGKAVLVIHTWKDHLWEMGSKPDMPEGTILDVSNPDREFAEGLSTPTEEQPETVELQAESSASSASQSESPKHITYSPQEVTELLNKALIQAISESLSSLPSSAFPMPATILYSNHILPSRPAFPTLVLPPSSLDVSDAGPSSSDPPPVDTDITIKSSSHKSLTAFLKAAEKSGLLTLKPPQKQQPDVLVMSVNASHPNVTSCEAFVTIKSLEAKAAKKAAREEKEREAQAGSVEVQVKELWKPYQITIDLFEAMSASKSDFYTPTQVSQLVNNYIKTHNLVNQNEQAYVNLDHLLRACVSTTGKAKAKADDNPPLQFMRRDELVKSVLERMQNWYEIRADRKDVVTKKGTLMPIHVVTKFRQGRKACTLVTGFEPFLVIDAQEMADELRKMCAGATSLSPIPGRPAGSGVEVLVQGKQSKSVVNYLQSKGIPKRWIEVSDLSGKK